MQNKENVGQTRNLRGTMIRRLFYASLKLGRHETSGDNVEVEGVRGGSLSRQPKR